MSQQKIICRIMVINVLMLCFITFLPKTFQTEIYDLQGNFTEQDVSGWQIFTKTWWNSSFEVPSNLPLVSYCDGAALLGGPGNKLLVGNNSYSGRFTKIYTVLDYAASVIQLHFNIFIIDYKFLGYSFYINGNSLSIGIS